jgi:hypothetical protein
MRRFSKKTARPALDRREALQCVPMKNRSVREDRLENGDVVLEYPLAVRPWIQRLERRLGRVETGPTYRRLQLDELGTRTWDLMDNVRTVGQIARAFAVGFQLEQKEAEAAVSRFVRELGRRGIIGLR